MMVATYLSGRCTLFPDLVLVSAVAELCRRVLFIADSLFGDCSAVNLDDFIVVYFSVLSKTLVSLYRR